MLYNLYIKSIVVKIVTGGFELNHTSHREVKKRWWCWVVYIDTSSRVAFTSKYAKLTNISSLFLVIDRLSPLNHFIII